MYFLSTKCNHYILSLFMIVLFIIYYIHLHNKFYYKNIEELINNNTNEEIIQQIIKTKNIKDEFDKYKLLKNIQVYLGLIGFAMLLFGFYIYSIRQFQEHKINWSWTKFIFGVEKCDHNYNITS